MKEYRFPRVYGDRPALISGEAQTYVDCGFPVCTGIDPWQGAGIINAGRMGFPRVYGDRPFISPNRQAALPDWFPRVYGDRPRPEGSYRAKALNGFPRVYGDRPAEDPSGRGLAHV